MLSFPHAKINIGLYVTARRSDGYHHIETVFYPVAIEDVLEVVEDDELVFETSGIDIPGFADENLCLKAYQLIRRDCSIPPVRIHLHKHIPIGAGLGGGSADAAFFIRLLNDKFSLGLDTQAMEGYARQLGADCAYFMRKEPVFAYGRGDEFEPVALSLKGYYIVVVVPPIHIPTAEAYRGVRPQIPEKPLKSLIALPLTEWKSEIKNDFEDYVFQHYPEIRGIKAMLYQAGAVYASMSGSGSSVYGIFNHEVRFPDLEQEYRVFYLPQKS